MNKARYRLAIAGIITPTAVGLAVLATTAANVGTQHSSSAASPVAAAIPAPAASVDGPISTGAHAAPMPKQPHAKPKPKLAPEPSTPVYRLAYRVVYVEDHTGNQWPIREAARSWDRGTILSIRYGRCRPHASCIRAYDGHYGDTGWYGLTTWNDLTDTAVIKFNDSARGGDAHDRRQAACHEEGHALGLGYHSTFASCMYSGATARASAYPSVHDKNVMNALY